MREAEGGSIAAIIFALKAARPHLYRDNYRVELTGRDGGPISTATAVGGTVNHHLHLSGEDLERIAASGLEDVATLPESSYPSEGPNGRLGLAGPDTGAALDPADAK